MKKISVHVNPFVTLPGAFVIAVHHSIGPAEENHLQTVFGQKYTAYCSRVGRYIQLPAFGVSKKLPRSLTDRTAEESAVVLLPAVGENGAHDGRGRMRPPTSLSCFIPPTPFF